MCHYHCHFYFETTFESVASDLVRKWREWPTKGRESTQRWYPPSRWVALMQKLRMTGNLHCRLDQVAVSPRNPETIQCHIDAIEMRRRSELTLIAAKVGHAGPSGSRQKGRGILVDEWWLACFKRSKRPVRGTSGKRLSFGGF